MFVDIYIGQKANISETGTDADVLTLAEVTAEMSKKRFTRLGCFGSMVK